MSDEPQLSSSETYQLSTPRLRSSLQSPPRSPLQHDVRSSHGLESNLSELPPTPTLEGLAASSASAADGGYSVGRLDSIVAQASMADRELAARTTLASKQLRQWYAEVSSWEWPAVGRPGVSTGFEVPNKEERASKPRNFSDELNERDGNLQGNVHMLDLNGTPMQETFKSGDGQQQTDGVEEEYWGGCPARLVEQYQDRIDAIAAGIVELDLGDLQDRVLGMSSAQIIPCSLTVRLIFLQMPTFLRGQVTPIRKKPTATLMLPHRSPTLMTLQLLLRVHYFRHFRT